MEHSRIPSHSTAKLFQDHLELLFIDVLILNAYHAYLTILQLKEESVLNAQLFTLCKMKCA